MSQATRARSVGEVVVALRTEGHRVPVVTQVRSTLLASSVRVLRAQGLLDRYLALLPSALHDPVLSAVAGSWMPLSIAMAHYGAADSLGLSTQEQFENGRRVADQIQNTMLGTVARAAKGAGVTPWVGLEYFQRLWDRIMVGGSGAVYRLGPKEARVECHGVPLVEYAYFRNAWRGMFAGSGALFCSRMFVTELPRLRDAPFVLRVAWA
jgi:hypothetical protein